MSNEIPNSTTVRMPTSTPVAAAGTERATPQSGKALPVAEATERPPEPPSDHDIQQAVEVFSQHATNIGRDLLFEVDDKSGQTVIKVIDPETEEIVRQIPSEEAVERARARGSQGVHLIDDLI